LPRAFIVNTEVIDGGFGISRECALEDTFVLFFNCSRVVWYWPRETTIAVGTSPSLMDRSMGEPQARMSDRWKTVCR
jgi:hypothetical protein